MSGGSTKKLIATALLTCFLASHSSYTFANTLHGSIQKENQQIEQENIFTGEIHTVEEKEVINMTVSQVLSGAYSQEGDEFFAEITQEVRGKRGVVLPVGTIAHGTIRQIEDAKRMGRDAWVEMDFDYLTKIINCETTPTLAEANMIAYALDIEPQLFYQV